MPIVCSTIVNHNIPGQRLTFFRRHTCVAKSRPYNTFFRDVDDASLTTIPNQGERFREQYYRKFDIIENPSTYIWHG